VSVKDEAAAAAERLAHEDELRDTIEAKVSPICPRCGSGNAGRARHIEIERAIAVCNACGHGGPLSTFQQGTE